MIEETESKIELIEAKDEELYELAELAKVIWHDHYTSIIGKEQIEYMLDKFYSKTALIQQKKEGQQFSFVLQKGNKIGFIATSFKSECECFIHKFYLKTDHQSKSIGSLVMNKIKQTFRTSNCETFIFRLTVNRQNYKAINFYFKNGFKIESVADFDIGNGYLMNDFIMVSKMQFNGV